MTEPLLPSLLSVQAQAVVDRAKALGLTWTLRPGAISSSTSTPPEVIYDGDTEPVGATSLVGSVLPTDRVMLLQVPPAGNFIVGRIGGTVTMPKALPTYRGELAATGDVILTTASQAIIPLLTLEISSPAEYFMTPNVDWDAFVAGGNNLCAATLQVDGVGLANQMIFQENTSGVRIVASKTYYGTLTSGTHTFQMIAAKSLNTGGWAVRAAGTSLVYQIFQ